MSEPKHEGKSAKEWYDLCQEALNALEQIKSWYQIGPNEHDDQCELKQGGKYCDCPNKLLHVLERARS